jgi:hypothetical protein
VETQQPQLQVLLALAPQVILVLVRLALALRVLLALVRLVLEMVTQQATMAAVAVVATGDYLA